MKIKTRSSVSYRPQHAPKTPKAIMTLDKARIENRLKIVKAKQ